VAAGEREEAFVDVVAAVGADEETAAVVQPGDGAVDHPAFAAEAGAVLLVAGGIATPIPRSRSSRRRSRES
jgi:hypothetical protein